jgi:hypothetical protein
MRINKKLIFTNHAIERLSLRGIKKDMVEYCVKYGNIRGRTRNTVFIYEYNDLVVVLGKNNVEVVTAYWKEEEENGLNN